jgi:type IV fimbrial biogenesis protein FimT
MIFTDSSYRKSAGFTLIELMVTVGLVAILLSIATPSFVTFQRNSELTTITNNFIAALSSARSEAMKRNMTAMIIPSGNGSDWNQGWIVFVDVNRNNRYDSSDISVMQQQTPPGYITFTGNGTASETPISYVMYDASGFSRTTSGGFGANTLQVSRNDIGSTDFSQIRRIKIASTGRVRACTPKSGSDAACKANADNT